MNYMKKEIRIKIDICGQAGTGKTTIAHKIGRILKKEGFDVSIIDDIWDDYSNYTEENIDRNLKSMATKTEVVIESVQIKRIITL